MKRVLVVAPHADDETLGCGGTLLRCADKGIETHWLLLTNIDERSGANVETVAKRKNEIKQVAKAYGFAGVHEMNFLPTKLNTIPLADLVQSIGGVVQSVKPDTLFLPSELDAHSDHQIAFKASVSCAKWFRYPSLSRVYAYETLSESNFGLNMGSLSFNPNVFIEISQYIDKKIDIMKLYTDEMGTFPFPRSEEAIRALATVRGIASGYKAAESFVLLKESLAF